MAVNVAQGELVTGELLEVSDGTLVLGLRGTDYRLHLVSAGRLDAMAHSLVTGRIFAQARRVDRVVHGGRYIEPVYGRPRRLQGHVIAVDAAAHTLTIRGGAGCPFICTLMPEQQPADFPPGTFVACDVERGARFEPA